MFKEKTVLLKINKTKKLVIWEKINLFSVWVNNFVKPMSNFSNVKILENIFFYFEMDKYKFLDLFFSNYLFCQIVDKTIFNLTKSKCETIINNSFISKIVGKSFVFYFC